MTTRPGRSVPLSHANASGKALPLILGLVVLAAAAFFALGDPFGSGGMHGDDDEGSHGLGDMMSGSGDGAAATTAPKKKAISLAGLYGDGQTGAIRLRLLWVGGDGRPVVGQEVALFSRSGSEVTRTPSDTDGSVIFAQVAPAKGYSLRIQGEGFSEVHLQGISVFPEATKDLGDLILGKDIALRGRVVDAQGRPVPGTSVSVHTIERDMATKGMLFTMAEQAASVPFPLHAVQTDEEGNFAIGGLKDGQYSLTARHQGYASRHEGEVIVASERGAGVLTMVLGVAGRVMGRVTDYDGKPIEGAQVIALRDTGWRGRMQSLEREVALTAKDGSYVIDTLGAGSKYRFGVVAKGFAPVYTTASVDITEGDLQQDFNLAEGGNLEGVVTDEVTGRPIANAKVAVFVGPMNFGGGGGNPDDKAVADTRLTDDEGKFRFESITPGPVSSSVVRAQGYSSVMTSQWTGNLWPAVEAGQTTEVTVTMKRGGSIRGFVRTSAGKEPIQGAQVTVMGTGWAAMGAVWAGAPTAITSADGGYELTGIVPGKYKLYSSAAGYSSDGGQEGTDVELTETNLSAEKDLTMSAAGTVTGLVVDAAGEPIAGVRVRMKPGRDPEANTDQRRQRRGGDMARRFLNSGRSPVDLSAEDGSFRLDGVSTESMWIVYGESDEYVSGESKAFKIAAGEVKTIKITMVAGGALRGRVVDENGRVVAGARVQVGHLDEDLVGEKNLSSWQASAALGSEVYMTDESGRFLATNLEPGPGIVRASKEGYVTFFKRNFSITPGETYDGYSIALSQGEDVEGRVVDADGRPIERAMIAVTKQANPGAQEETNADEEESEDVEPMMFARTDADGRYKIENVKPGVYSVVVWMAGGSKGWARDRDEAAIHREVQIPASPQDFKLNKAEPRPNPMANGGGNRGG
jgi:protocatechuate 3,4-dioxygenase beta subunit